MEDLPGDRSGNRDMIYDLFLQYESIKREMQCYDISDVCHHIWRNLKKEGYSGVPLHSFSVDETQDCTQAELRIFIAVCSDKNDMFFSGDTCQTISSGVGFRFEDLKVLFQKTKSEADPRSHMKITVPEVIAMQTNYRTHDGILGCAASVVDLIEKFFPLTLDKLPRESGFYQGPKPILLTETSPESATIMIVGSNKKASQIEFGASQVILVRTQEAKDELPDAFKECLMLTILESKGLEFDTVFLWNFWTDSRADDEWRLALTALVEDDEERMAELSAQRAEATRKECGDMAEDIREAGGLVGIRRSRAAQRSAGMVGVGGRGGGHKWNGGRRRCWRRGGGQCGAQFQTKGIYSQACDACEGSRGRKELEDANKVTDHKAAFYIGGQRGWCGHRQRRSRAAQTRPWLRRL
jgi:superfamily I DNA/RNA helicase